jgi:hypothetical protein
MSSTKQYDNIDLLLDLDQALNFLTSAVKKLNNRRIDSENYRVRIDNHPLTIGLAIENLLRSIRRDCINEQGTLSLAFFAVRTIHELCLDVAAVNFSDIKFSGRDEQILWESRLMQILASEKDVKIMKRLVTEFKLSISKGCFSELNDMISQYSADSHYNRQGFYHKLNDIANKKTKSLLKKLPEGDTFNHPAFLRFSHVESNVIFSNLLHGNPTSVLIASEGRELSATIPFMLLRFSLYDAELISGYLLDINLKLEIERLREKVLLKAYSAL